MFIKEYTFQSPEVVYQYSTSDVNVDYFKDWCEKNLVGKYWVNYNQKNNVVMFGVNLPDDNECFKRAWC